MLFPVCVSLFVTLSFVTFPGSGVTYVRTLNIVGCICFALPSMCPSCSRHVYSYYRADGRWTKQTAAVYLLSDICVYRHWTVRFMVNGPCLRFCAINRTPEWQTTSCRSCMSADGRGEKYVPVASSSYWFWGAWNVEFLGKMNLDKIDDDNDSIRVISVRISRHLTAGMWNRMSRLGGCNADKMSNVKFHSSAHCSSIMLSPPYLANWVTCKPSQLYL